MTLNLLETTVEEYWDWFAVAMYILIPVDMITTIYAAWSVGLDAEANPLIRWALNEGTSTLVAMNLVATVIAGVTFYVLMQVFDGTETRSNRLWAFGIQLWLGLLIAIGLYVFANNLVVIFHGRSLTLVS